MMISRKEMKEALLTEVSQVYFCDHTLNNSFLFFEIDKTIQAMNEHELLPLGICLDAPDADNTEYGFSFYNLTYGTHQWVHITKRIVQSWLKQLGITPPNDVIWNNDVWEKYIWKNQRIEGETQNAR